MNRLEYKEFVAGGEHQQLEFKSKIVEGAVAEQIILGLANTAGGHLLIGVADDGKPIGLAGEDRKHAVSIIRQLTNTYDRLELKTRELKIADSPIIDVVVRPVEDIHQQIADRSGRVWHRIGEQTRQADAANHASPDFQVYRSNQRLPFGALKSALIKLRPRCAYPGCAVTDPLECASVSSLEPGGPRFSPEVTPQDRHALRNFLLLCPNHHVIVDRDPGKHNLDWMIEARQRWLNNESMPSAISGKPPTCFLSYAWQCDAHVAWVACLACDLQEKMGVAVLLDTWELRPGDSITQFMENAVDDSDFVAMVLTPEYVARAKTREGGVGYEGGIVTGMMLEGRDPRQLVPILRGDPKESIPTFLKGKMYIDFRQDETYSDCLEELGRAIHDAPKAVPPPIGLPPWKSA